MIIALTLIPWVLTVAALMFIITRDKKIDQEEPAPLDNIEDTIRVAFYGNKAYWVYENVFYEAETIPEPDFDTARPIDTSSMSSGQLRQLFTILDELKEQGKE